MGTSRIGARTRRRRSPRQNVIASPGGFRGASHGDSRPAGHIGEARADASSILPVGRHCSRRLHVPRLLPELLSEPLVRDAEGDAAAHALVPGAWDDLQPLAPLRGPAAGTNRRQETQVAQTRRMGGARHRVCDDRDRQHCCVRSAQSRLRRDQSQRVLRGSVLRPCRVRILRRAGRSMARAERIPQAADASVLHTAPARRSSAAGRSRGWERAHHGPTSSVRMRRSSPPVRVTT